MRSLLSRFQFETCQFDLVTRENAILSARHVAVIGQQSSPQLINRKFIRSLPQAHNKQGFYFNRIFCFGILHLHI